MTERVQGIWGVGLTRFSMGLRIQGFRVRDKFTVEV